jgi:hypothetical protein
MSPESRETADNSIMVHLQLLHLILVAPLKKIALKAVVSSICNASFVIPGVSYERPVGFI